MRRERRGKRKRAAILFLSWPVAVVAVVSFASQRRGKGNKIKCRPITAVFTIGNPVTVCHISNSNEWTFFSSHLICSTAFFPPFPSFATFPSLLAILFYEDSKRTLRQAGRAGSHHYCSCVFCSMRRRIRGNDAPYPSPLLLNSVLSYKLYTPFHLRIPSAYAHVLYVCRLFVQFVLLVILFDCFIL